MAGIIASERRGGREPSELMPRDILFLHHCYESKFNVSEAARRAGITVGAGHAIMRKEKARKWLLERMGEDTPTPEEIMFQLTSIARTSMADFVEIIDGMPRVNWEKAVQTGGIHSIKRLKFNEQGLPEFEFYSKLEALQVLAKVMGMLVDRTHVEIDASLKIRVDEVRNNMRSLMNDPTKLNQAIELARSLASAGVGKGTTLPPAPIEATAREA